MASGHSALAICPLMALLGCMGFAAESGGEKLFLRQGFPFVDAMINGRGPFRMLIDTGAGSCLLTPHAARKAGIRFDHRVALATLAGEKLISGSSGNDVRIGATERPEIAINVLDLDRVQTLDRWADGVIGQNFLSKSAYLIDFKRRRLWIGDEAVQRAAELPIAITVEQFEGRIIVPVLLGRQARPWRLTLDSGASDLVVECTNHCPSLPKTAVDRLLTLAGDRFVSHGALSQIAIGGVPISPGEIVMVDTAPPDDRDEGVLPARWFGAVYVDAVEVRLDPAR